MFSAVNTSKDSNSSVKILFNKIEYSGFVTRSLKRNYYRLFIPSELSDKLKDTFQMSYMRFIETKLRVRDKKYIGSNIEEEIPFWEFLDLEFDSKNKVFHLTAHYIQKPMFIELFTEIVNSHVIKDIEDLLNLKEGFRIIKEKWKTRESLKSQIDAKNVIYNLIDVDNKQFYIGEAESLVNRLSGRRNEIPNWTHYRFDSLPNGLTRQQRVAIERLLIRSFASFLPNSKGIDSMNISNFHITNKKIDN